MINNNIKVIQINQNNDNIISHHNGFSESCLRVIKNNITPRI